MHFGASNEGAHQSAHSQISAQLTARDGIIDVSASPRPCGLLLIVTIIIRVSEIPAAQLRDRIVPYTTQAIPAPANPK